MTLLANPFHLKSTRAGEKTQTTLLGVAPKWHWALVKLQHSIFLPFRPSCARCARATRKHALSYYRTIRAQHMATSPRNLTRRALGRYGRDLKAALWRPFPGRPGHQQHRKSFSLLRPAAARPEKHICLPFIYQWGADVLRIGTP